MLNKSPRVYLAAPLFSECERRFNEELADELEATAAVYLPQRDGGLMSEMVLSGESPDVAAQTIFEWDMKAIRNSDFLIAVLDGRTIDEGVAFELGVGSCYSKRCIGLQTDSRRLASWGNNPMISGALERCFTDRVQFLDWFAVEATKHRTQFLC